MSVGEEERRIPEVLCLRLKPRLPHVLRQPHVVDVERSECEAVTGEAEQSPRYCRDSVLDIRRVSSKPGLSIRRAASRTRGRVAPLPPSSRGVRAVATRDTQG